MVDLNTEVVQAIITGGAVVIAAILTAAIGYFANKALVDYKAKHEILKDQLNVVYEPIMSIFLQNGLNLTDENVTQISKLLFECNSLAAPGLVRSWKEVCNKESEVNYRPFIEIFRSNYNFVKKQLGYPYVAEDIKEKYHPNGYIETKRIAAYALALTIVFVFAVTGATLEGNGIVRITLHTEAYLLLLVGIMLWTSVIARLLSGFKEWLHDRREIKDQEKRNKTAESEEKKTDKQ